MFDSVHNLAFILLTSHIIVDNSGSGFFGVRLSCLSALKSPTRSCLTLVSSCLHLVLLHAVPFFP